MKHYNKFFCVLAVVNVLLVKAGTGNNPISGNSFFFTENKGQLTGMDGRKHEEVKYYQNRGASHVYLLTNGLAYQFTRLHGVTRHAGTDFKNPRLFNELLKESEQTRIETYRTDLILVGANNNPRITSEQMLPYYEHHYNHNVLNVRSYSRIVYHDVYPGIDWVLQGNGQSFKYDFIVHPGADPSLIRIRFSHSNEMKITPAGDFELQTEMGTITELHPVSFQGPNSIGTSFLLQDNVLSFDVGTYDPNVDLIIDPTVTWATYYGGSGSEDGNEVATDAAGNVYMVGRTVSAGNIASGGHQNTYGGNTDGFIVKFDASGARLWATYYGGSGLDFAYDVKIDANNDVYVAGSAASSANISAGGHQATYGGGISDAYLLKLNSSGTRVWATYYGGNSEDYGGGCAVDNSGNVYLCGSTKSTGNIASGGHLNSQSGARNAFLVKFNSAGVRQWGTYYGVTGTTDGNACATDGSGFVYLGGETDYATDIAFNGHQMSFGGSSSFNSAGFLAQFDPSGVRQWGTYYGGDAYDKIMDCVTDASGNVYVVGGTLSDDGIATPGSAHANYYGAYDCFIAKFSNAGTRQWGTYFGTFEQEIFYSATVDASNNIYAAGYMETVQNNEDFIVVRITPSGAFDWIQQFGGTGFDFGSGVAVNGGNTYVCGTTDSPSGIATNGFQNNLGGSYDAGLVKFGCYAVDPAITTNKQTFCKGDLVVANGIGNYTFTWHTGGTGSTVQFIANNSAQFNVQYVDSIGCPGTAQFNIIANDCPGVASQSPDNGFSLSPNPTSGLIRIVSFSDQPFELFDLEGRKLREGLLSKGQNEMDLTGYRPGVYLIRSGGAFQKVLVN